MKHVVVKKKCSKCNQGEMKGTGVVFTVYPPLYQHKCEKCGETRSFNDCYPYNYDEYEQDELQEEWAE